MTVITPRLHIEPLQVEHLPELAMQLRHPEVYAHIGGVPSLEDFILDRVRSLEGPGPAAGDEQWLNFLARERTSGQMLRRLEATLHDGIAEVAFLFGVSHWGRGFAYEGLAWMHDEIQQSCGITNFWATTVPENTRCQSLLLRSGYTQVHAAPPMLYSYEPGDLVFHRRGAA